MTQGLDLLHQPDEFDRLRVVVVASDGQCSFPVTDHRMRGEGDERDPGSLRIGLKLRGDVPSTHDRQTKIEEDQVRWSALRHGQALRSVDGTGDAESPPLETPREHVAIELVVVDQQYVHFVQRPSG